MNARQVFCFGGFSLEVNQSESPSSCWGSFNLEDEEGNPLE